jgi:hypothetical protein
MQEKWKKLRRIRYEKEFNYEIKKIFLFEKFTRDFFGGDE